MRVTQIMVAKEFGGAERSFVDTALALAERGHQVQAICHPLFPGMDLITGKPNVQVDRVNVRGWWDWRSVRRMAQLLTSFGSQVVHTQMARAAWLGGKAARRVSIPVIAKLHNYANLAYYRHVDHFVATTPDQHAYLRREGIADERISVIPNFSRIAPVDRPQVRSGDDIVFVTLGRLVPEKAIDVLIASLAEVRRGGIPARLIVGGDGPLKDELMQHAQRQGVHDHIEWAGWVNDVESFLSRGDVFVLPSRSESFGIVLLEAMARGVPIITTKTKGPSQVVSEKEAWLVTPDDAAALTTALREAASEVSMVSAKANAALALYHHKYFESAVVPRLESLYQHAIATHTSGARHWRSTGIRRSAA